MNTVITLAPNVEGETVGVTDARLDRISDSPELNFTPKEMSLLLCCCDGRGCAGLTDRILGGEEVHFDRGEIDRVTIKRKKRVIIPLRSELYELLEVEHSRWNPDPDERVLLHPVEKTPMSRQQLYRRMIALVGSPSRIAGSQFTPRNPCGKG